jgi:hypothetical protein
MTFDQEHARHLASLQARMNRMEGMMYQLLGILSSTGLDRNQYEHIQAMLQALRSSPDFHEGSMVATPGGYPSQAAGGAPGGFPQQERPELAAIRAAALAGDKIKAIKLYRELYGVDFKTAEAAVQTL